MGKSKTKTTTKTETEASVSRLAAALKAHERAKTERRPEDNPFAEHDLKQMGSAGLRRSADRFPAQNMAVHEGVGREMELARFETQQEVKSEKTAKRKAQARARAARKAEFDKIASSPVAPNPERMHEAWVIVALMLPTIQRIANGKRQWASRFLGDVTDDVVGAVVENMAQMLAKSDKDLEVLEVAARQISEKVRRTQQIPGDQLTDDERKERRTLAKARKWLMQVANNRVMDTLVDVYLRSHNLRWTNLDIIATVMANINGVGDDPMVSRFKADRAPAFLGTRFQRPGGVDAGLLATAINAAITERGLDRMVELLLNEENRRVDGSFKWSELAEQVFLAGPDGDGEWYWQVVCQSTTGRNRDGVEWTMDRARKARGDAARTFARNEFDWLPGLIMAVIDSFDPKALGWSIRGNQRHAFMASDFELLYMGDEPERREVLSPVLRFADAGEAAQALIEHLAALVTGEDLVASVVNA